MNYAQILYKLESDKENLLKQSKADLLGHFFCFVNVTPVRFLTSKIKGGENLGARIIFEIISVDDTEKNDFYSLTFTTTLNFDKNNHIQCSHSSHTTVKTINPKGIFFIHNYTDLNENQKKEFLKNIKDYYLKLQKKQDQYTDCLAVSCLETTHIVDYFKSNKNTNLNDFINNIEDSVTHLVDKNLSSFVYQKISDNFHITDKIYYLTIEEKQKLTQEIHDNFLDNIKNSLHMIKREGSYQDDWIVTHNQAVDYFIKTM